MVADTDPTTARSADRPFVLGLGGTTRADSSSQRAVAAALETAGRMGATTRLLPAVELDFPAYSPGVPQRSAAIDDFLAEVKRADALVIASPGYHGSISGLLKNALDYIEELREGPRPYLDGRPVGCIACAYGWQAANTTLGALRSIVHALRGWPTPLGVTINSDQTAVRDTDPVTAAQPQLDILAGHLVRFSRAHAALR